MSDSTLAIEYSVYPDEDPRYIDDVKRRMRSDLGRKLAESLIEGQPVTVMIEGLEDQRRGPMKRIGYRLQCRFVRMLDVTMMRRIEPDYRVREPRPSPKPKPLPIATRLANWWKEMQKPLPYDGGYA